MKLDLVTETQEGEIVEKELQELEKILADENSKVESLQNTKEKAKEDQTEIDKLCNVKAKLQSNNAKLKAQLSDTKFELEWKKENFDMLERNLSLQITEMNSKIENNQFELATVKKTLKVKNPIYAKVKTVADEKETAYSTIKSQFASKGMKASKLKNKIGVLDEKCSKLREKSKIMQDERRSKMDGTKVLLKSKGEILTNYDEQKYQLLIEKEQFLEANEIINKQISSFQDNIGTMNCSDRVLEDLIREFADGLDFDLSASRQDFIKFAAKTKTRGKRVIFEDRIKLEELEQNHEPNHVVDLH